MFKPLLLFSFVLFTLPCLAQQKYTTEKTAKKKQLEAFRKSQRLSFNGQTDAAIAGLEKILKSDPLFIDARIEWANVKNQQGLFAAAEQGYEKVLDIDPDYEPGVLYSLAIVEFDQGKFDEATGHFEAYLSQKGISPRRKQRAETYLANAAFASNALRNPVPFEPKNMGPAINTNDHEYLPILTADGQTLIYTAVRGRQEDFYLSRKKDSIWQQGEPILSVNTPYNEGAQSVSADGKLLVFTICNQPGGLGRCDLYFTEYKGDQWTPVRNLGAPVNSSGYESLPSLSADGQTLFFNSDRKGGLGGLDIWVSRRNPDGTWRNPENLGTPVNTPEDEQAPFIHPDGQTLYFMSKGHPGMGEYDLYLSRLQPDGSWGKPQNLGYPINTQGNEGAFTVSLDGKTAYFASDMEGGYGKNDIYTFELHEAARPQPVTYVKALVTDALTRAPLVAEVEFVDLESGQAHVSSSTGEDGEFLITLPAGKDYALNVSKDQYLFYSENFALKDTASFDQPFELNIELTPIPRTTEGGVAELSKPVVLKNVFFETGSAALKAESRTELNRLTRLLEENAGLRIQVNGHTDNVGTEADNMQLSEDRARSVYDYLIEKGIDADRLQFKGYGETRPIASNDTEEGRKQNRRTEFVVVQ